MSEIDPKAFQAAMKAADAEDGSWFEMDLKKAITAYLSTVSPLSDGDGWQPIETAPSSKIDVLFYRRDAVWHDSRTNAPAVVPDGVRYDFGYWDEEFFYHGTNHAVFEFGAKPGDFGDNPTHWRPLPAGPRGEVAHD